MLTRVSILLPALLAGALTVANSVDAEVPRWCATIGDEARANTPSCQEPTGDAKICQDLGAEAQKIHADWMNGAAYLKAERYGQSVTVRASWGRNVRSSTEASSLVANAESRYPTVLDHLLALRCVDHMPPSVISNWSDEVLLAMVNKGTLTWDKWATWANQ